MSTALIALLPLLGVVIGALLTSFVSLLNSYFQSVALEEKEKKKLVLEKLEQLFENVDSFKIYHQNSFYKYHRFLIGTESIPKIYDDHIPVGRILALVAFYAPELNSQFDDILTESNNFAAFRKAVLLYVQKGVPDSAEIEQITKDGDEKLKKLISSCLKLQEATANSTKKYIEIK